MDAQQVYNAAANAGFSGSALAIAVAVAYAESKFDEQAIGDINLQDSKWGPSVGLWQIRSLNNNFLNIEPVRDYNKLFDPDYNARAAYEISKGGKDWSPWSTYLNNSYKSYLSMSEGLTNNAGIFKLIIAVVVIIILFRYVKH